MDRPRGRDRGIKLETRKSENLEISLGIHLALKLSRYPCLIGGSLPKFHGE